MTDRMVDTAARVLAIAPIDGSVDPNEPDVLLLRDYFAKVDVVAKSLPAWRDGPFFDPSKLVARDLSPEHARLVDEVNARLAQRNGYVSKVCVAAVTWAGYAVEGEFLACEHEDLFEPLLRLFERGIGFTIHHREILIGRFALPLRTWRWVLRGSQWVPPDA